MKVHVVSQGECLTMIAHQHHFADVMAIYNDPANADLRRRRPNPDVLYPGDEVVIPDPEVIRQMCATGRAHWFTVGRLQKQLVLHLQGADGKPLVGVEYHLVIDGERRSPATTGRDGRVEAAVPMRAATGELVLCGVTFELDLGHLNPVAAAPDDGMSGVQARLRNLGYDPGPLDGRYGPRTAAAIRAFQRDHQLAVDGVLSAKLRGRLVEEHGA